MKEIKLKGLDISLYKETLNNGLEIYLLPYENKKDYFISYATRYGSDVVEFTDKDGNEYKPPLGVAHFLEHKMFEQEDGTDPFTFFSESGTDSNASTSFDSTQYICGGTKKFRENLRYLLRFVNEPYYTDENVEKEKGIIAEEIKMYQDIPDYKLETILRECIYEKNQRRIDIAGTVEEINKITKEDLYNCYNGFYKPNNMFILIVGNFDKRDAIEVIKEELAKKEESNISKIKVEKEPNNVYVKEKTVEENIEVSKVALGLKVPTKKLSLKGAELDMYLSMITTILFGPSSEFRERVRIEKLLSSIYTEWENLDEFRTFYIMSSTINAKSMIEEIKYELETLAVDEKSFNRIKKVWIANETKMIDNIDQTVYNLYDDIIRYKDIIPNKIEMIKKMSFKKLNEIIKEIDFKNYSVVTMNKKNN